MPVCSATFLGFFSSSLREPDEELEEWKEKGDERDRAGAEEEEEEEEGTTFSGAERVGCLFFGVDNLEDAFTAGTSFTSIGLC